MGIISKERVINVIDNAEIELRDCFRRLVLLKNLDDNIQDIMDFQPKLAVCLYDLMLFYRELCQEEKQLIEQKASFDNEQFKSYMASNSKNKTAIKEMINIGKSLGDSFVWFFYRDNLDELEKHFKHKSTGLFVLGIGGLGELEFIKNTSTISGNVVLYHGMTSMLRVGDISLWKPGTGIIAIGELKTKPQAENHISVDVFITSKIHFIPNVGDSFSFEFDPSNISDKDRDRFQKQMNNQSNIFKKEDTIGNKELYSDYNYKLLNDLDIEKVCVNVSEDKTLMVFGVSAEGRKLSDILTGEKIDFSIPTSNHDKVEKILIKSSDNNRFALGLLDCEIFSGRIPLFWWDTNIEIIEKILFKELFISTVFNPAKFLDYFTNKGYSTVLDKKGKIIALEKYNGDKKQVFNALDMVFDLITHSFMKCDAAIKMVDTFLSEVENIDVDLNTMVNMKIRHNGL